MNSKATLVRAGVFLGTLALGLVSPMGAAAQYEAVPEPPAYALRNVTVVQPDGGRTEGVTLVVRGPLIEVLARDQEVPADATVLEGDSLMVYPGFVDGDGTAGHEFPSPDIDRSEIEIWNAPRALQGFMPARRLVSHLTAVGDDLEGQRQAGIVAAAVHPLGGLMPGRGTLLLHRPDAQTPEALVLEPVLGPSFTFQGGRGVYPGTLFGVTAFIRQAFEDARHRAVLARAHAEDPRGLPAPQYDPDYAVLHAVAEEDIPVYFRADGAADILRALGLADEYGFDPVIVGGGEAWRVADELRRRGTPVLVSVDFAEPRRWDPESDTTGALDAAAEREKQGLENRYANAGRLAAAGVTFALTSGQSGKILDGARKAVEHGLAEDAALAAMTATPARLFGVGWVPRIAEGLPATFVVTDGPLFDEDTKIAYTFVEGHKEDGAKPRAEGSADEAVDFAGTWEMTIDAQGQVMNAVLVIEQDGATFTGHMEMQGQRLELREGMIDGNEITVTAVMEQGGETLDVEITGTVDGDQASGEADAGPMGVADWTARRTGPGGAR